MKSVLRFTLCLIPVLLLSEGPSVFGQTLSSHFGSRSSLAIARQGQPGTRYPLSCAHAPCVLPNVLITVEESYNTTVAANPENNSQLLAALDEYYYNNCPWGSVDGGSTWYQADASCTGFTPSLAYDTNGTAYQAGSSGFNKTTNNGRSWSTTIDAVGPIFNGGYYLTPWLALDSSSKSRYRGSLYIAVTQVNKQEVESEITVSYSRDGGNTWTIEIIDPVQVQPEVDRYSRIAVSNDGTVYVTWLRCEMSGNYADCGGSKADMLFSKSGDGGVTWSKPARIVTATLAPDSCDCAFFGNLPNTEQAVANPPFIAIDSTSGPNAGTLYVVVYDWTGKQMKIEVVASRDGGNTWGNPVLVAGAYKHDQFYPSLSISGAGVLGVTWLDRRNDPHDVSYQPFAAVSTDGGKSFGKNYRLARPLSNPYYGNLGDYTGNAWAGNTLCFTWPDSRNAIMQDYIGGLVTK